ncbi:hypothetical protein [Salinicola avicenniae]|uniref:hypothetical protein n=1 Tax=Salinicola avicenniae TaxID=2916836 RepID=UPI002073A7E1|nr:MULTISPECIES: hypothetical protein [unclassified Salinicola]
MNITHLEHAVIGMFIQTLLWPVTGRWVAGALVVAVFLGREIAQHEMAGGGANQVDYFYGMFHHWSMDSILDILTPIFACTLLAIAIPGSPLWKKKARFHALLPAKAKEQETEKREKARP